MDYLITASNDEEYISHYGILGMKWGVRHDRELVGQGSGVEIGEQIKHLPKDQQKKINKVVTKHKKELVSKYQRQGMTKTQAIEQANKDIENQKKLKIGLAIAGGALTLGAGVALYKTGGLGLLKKNSTSFYK